MNRYHNKFHRHNHHTLETNGDNDSSHDPIASSGDPFRGDFHLAGALRFTDSQNTIGSDNDVVVMGCDINISSFIIQGYNLNKVTDVELTNSADRDVLTWDDATSKWVNRPTSLVTISDIDDVTLSSLSNKEALIWDNVAGNWTNGYPYAVYADLAENYTIGGQFRTGNIVSAGSGRFGAEICTRKTFDKLLGVISQNPGMLLDAELPHGYPVAYIGKVDILVSGPCKKGDIIVLSKIDGVGKVAGKFDKKYKIGYAMEDSFIKGVSPVRCILKTM